MEEKYYIIDNANQYYVVIKCTEQQLDDYAQYGSKNCLTEEGALDLFKISDWLINRRIKHTVIFGSIKNIILKSLIKRDLDIILPKAIEKGLYISNEEIDRLLSMSEEKKNELFW